MSAWPWPDELDAVIAAPKYHRVIFENDRMRMLDTRLPPGDVVPVHTHRWPAVYYPNAFFGIYKRVVQKDLTSTVCTQYTSTN